ncbi:MAG: restriction endonuclease subunit S [Bacilli bacterium]|nr:restriction endonuclease subunit S [Bacilli bacterium]
MSEWKEVEFSKMLVDESISYGIVQPGAHTEINSIPIIRVNNIKNGYIKIDDVLKVEPSIEDKYKKTRLKGGELLITVVGSVGECAIVPDSLKGWNVARAVSVAKIKSEYDTRFIKYAFKTEDIIFQMYGNTNDTVQPTLNLSSLKTLKFNIPDFPEQTAIASVLSSLDDKIDLLHRQNATLEKMAETLFRQWFVEEAKEEWANRPLSSIAVFLNGLACQKFPPKNELEKLPVLKIKELSEGITDNSDFATTDVKSEYIIMNGDVIFAWSASLMVKIWDGQDCILNQHLFKVTSKDYPKWFYFLWCKFHLSEFISIAASHATTMGHIKRRDLNEAMVSVPSLVEMSEMTLIIEPLIDKLIVNNKQINLLVSYRDNLLKKLMSGDVKVAI